MRWWREILKQESDCASARLPIPLATWILNVLKAVDQRLKNIYKDFKCFVVLNPPCLTDRFEFGMSLSFSCFICPPFKSRLPFWRVGKETINALSCVIMLLISAIKQHLTTHRLRACSVCTLLSEMLHGYALLHPYSFQPLHLLHHPSAHKYYYAERWQSARRRMWIALPVTPIKHSGSQEPLQCI